MANKIEPSEVPANETEPSEVPRSRIIGCAGRGGKGKSWILRTLYEMASTAKKNEILIIDADPGNRTLADSIGGRATMRQPPTPSEGDRIKIMRAAIESASQKSMTIFADLGGNDQSLTQVTGETLDEEMKDAITAFGFPGIEDLDILSGVDMTILYPISHDPEDIKQLDAILASPLRNKDIILVHNMGLLPAVALSDSNPFERIEQSEVYKDAIKVGAKVWTFPALPPHISLDLVRTGTSFYDAVKGGKPLGTDKLTGEEVPVFPITERQSLQTWAGRVVLSIRAAGLEGKLG